MILAGLVCRAAWRACIATDLGSFLFLVSIPITVVLAIFTFSSVHARLGRPGWLRPLIAVPVLSVALLLLLLTPAIWIEIVVIASMVCYWIWQIATGKFQAGLLVSWIDVTTALLAAAIIDFLALGILFFTYPDAPLMWATFLIGVVLIVGYSRASRRPRPQA
jgi:hypothetical protein